MSNPCIVFPRKSIFSIPRYGFPAERHGNWGFRGHLRKKHQKTPTTCVLYMLYDANVFCKLKFLTSGGTEFRAIPKENDYLKAIFGISMKNYPIRIKLNKFQLCHMLRQDLKSVMKKCRLASPKMETDFKEVTLAFCAKGVWYTEYTMQRKRLRCQHATVGNVGSASLENGHTRHVVLVMSE